MTSSAPPATGPRWLAPLALVALLAAGASIVRQVVTAPTTRSVERAGDGAGELHGFILLPAKPAPDVTVTDAAGAPWRLADRRGKVVALFFGYTSCPDVCPQTLALLAAAKAALGDASDGLQVAMITVDPARDTPDVLARYMAGYDPSFVGLEAGADLQRIADGFGATYTRDLPPDVATRAAAIAGHDDSDGRGDADATRHTHDADLPDVFERDSPAYTVAHSGVVFLIDPEGRLRSSYLAPFDPAELAADVTLLLANGARSARAR